MAGIDILDLVEATEVNETTDYLAIVDKSDTSQDITGSTKRATVRKLLGDKALPSGDFVGTTDTQTLTDKTLSTGSVIDANVNVVEVLKKAYPVGCIYTSTVATNPSTLFGFGTWSEYGQGRVLVGKSAEAEFDTIGKTGGAKTHTLTTAEMPSHTHSYTLPNNSDPNFMTGGGSYNVKVAGGTGTDTTSVGSGSAHNNLQPYIVVYFWKRTA